MKDVRVEHPRSQLPDPACALKVLVVDDLPVNRLLMVLLLQHEGHTVCETGEGIEAVERVAAGGLDLVLMDIELPDINGLEATRRIRALPGMLNRIPVWIVSGHAQPHDVEASFAAGASGHLAKPVLFEALQDMLRQVQRLRRAEGQEQ